MNLDQWARTLYTVSAHPDLTLLVQSAFSGLLSFSGKVGDKQECYIEASSAGTWSIHSGPGSEKWDVGGAGAD